MQDFRIVHIHSDLKFTGNSKIFEDTRFVNQIIILGDKTNYNGPYKENAMFFKQNRKDIVRIINLCKMADMVVLYDLDLRKCIIANRLPSNIKIIWRFFGYELYDKMQEHVYSQLTMDLIKSNRYLVKLRSYISKVKQYIKWHTSYNNEFEKAINRVNYFLGLSKYEYDFLKRYWPNLPEFIQHPFTTQEQSYKYGQEKFNEIVIGNNRSAFNNHIDILELIERTKNRRNYNFKLFFNYGQNNKYTQAVRERAGKIEEVGIIEVFLSIEEFRSVYARVAAFVMNSYRQLAMANIFQALRNGVKVYLNHKNIIFDWLKAEGFLVYSIDDFSIDIETNNIRLKEEEVKYNLKQMADLAKKYNKNDFQQEIYKIILSKNPTF